MDKKRKVLEDLTNACHSIQATHGMGSGSFFLVLCSYFASEMAILKIPQDMVEGLLDVMKKQHSDLVAKVKELENT